MAKRLITFMSAAAVLALALPLNARADVIAEPENTFRGFSGEFVITVVIIIVVAVVTVLLVRLFKKRGRRK